MKHGMSLVARGIVLVGGTILGLSIVSTLDTTTPIGHIFMFITSTIGFIVMLYGFTFDYR